MLTLIKQPVTIRGAAQRLRSRIEPLFFGAIALFCLASVGLLVVISLSVLSDVLGGP